MPRNVYSEINLHIVWHTKQNANLLTEKIENRVYHFLKHRILQTPGIFFHSLGGTEDHVHLVVTVPPTLLISDWIGDLKGASAYYVNHEVTKRKWLDWQTGYGVVSFGTRDLPWVINYVRNQKEHHDQGTIHERLERIENSNTDLKPVKTGSDHICEPGTSRKRLA
ncbi:MAG: IS200/IS605 family transposase [Acidobacteriia bacterium]|nr:IS200/IS605 family transposase [Terriglobia bacterium]